MKAGRDLDALIAEKVMGWRVLSTWEPGVPKHLLNGNGCEVVPPEFTPYSTDIAAALEVVGHLDRWCFRLEFNTLAPTAWTAEFPGVLTKDSVKGAGDSPAHAICLAALEIIK